MNHLQRIASFVLVSAAALSFGCTSQMAEPGGAGDSTNPMDPTEDAYSLTSEDTSDNACTSEDEAVAESAEAVRYPPPRPPRECWRYFECMSRHDRRFCEYRYPRLARACRDDDGNHGGHDHHP